MLQAVEDIWSKVSHTCVEIHCLQHRCDCTSSPSPPHPFFNTPAREPSHDHKSSLSTQEESFWVNMDGSQHLSIVSVESRAALLQESDNMHHRAATMS
jgi:hypothetical protein